VDEADQGPGVLKGPMWGPKGCEGQMERRRGRTVFMFGESGEGLRLRALPHRGDAKPGWANT